MNKTNNINGTIFSVIIPSNRVGLLNDLAQHLNKIGINYIHKNGNNYDSFAKLINHSILESPTEIVVICNDKSRPTIENFEKMISLINKGFGFVGLYNFGFFGFKKELIRRVGFLDERFVGGNYEDCDYLRRLNEHNIACYQNLEINYIEGLSGWNTSRSREFFLAKWEDATPTNLVCRKKIEDEVYDYELGPPTNDTFLEWKESYINGSEWFVDVKIIK